VVIFTHWPLYPGENPFNLSCGRLCGHQRRLCGHQRRSGLFGEKKNLLFLPEKRNDITIIVKGVLWQKYLQ
jgi:hypothetical protein